MHYSPNKNRCITFTAVVSMQEDIRIYKETKKHITPIEGLVWANFWTIIKNSC